MSPKHQRLLGIIFIVAGIGIAISLSLWGLRENISFFYTPSDLTIEKPSDRFRLGGLVKQDSIIKTGLTTTFTVTDKTAKLNVTYDGLLPDLFKEGQGVIAFGVLNTQQNIFIADRLLAKHDENYIPPELAKKLKEQGHIAAP